MNAVGYILGCIGLIGAILIILFPERVRAFLLWRSFWWIYSSPSFEHWLRYKCTANKIRAIGILYLLGAVARGIHLIIQQK